VALTLFRSDPKGYVTQRFVIYVMLRRCANDKQNRACSSVIMPTSSLCLVIMTIAAHYSTSIL